MSSKKKFGSLFAWALDPDRQHRLNVLKKVPLLRGISHKLLRKLMMDLIEKEYAAGESVFREGETGKALYILIDGSVSILKQQNGGEKTLAVLGPGTHFGELALVSEEPRFASAVAATDSRILIMYKAYFDGLIRTNSPISSRVLLNLAGTLIHYLHCADGADMQS
ncbi:MAG: hypothetical protein OHK006_14760 [Thermodesulfovibrionales bacterium]